MLKILKNFFVLFLCINAFYNQTKIKVFSEDNKIITTEEIKNEEFNYCGIVYKILDRYKKTLSIQKFNPSPIKADLDFSKTQIQNTYYIIEDEIYEVVKIEPRAFEYGLIEISELVLPKTLKELADNAFEHCDFLEKVVLPENLKKIGKSCFKGCKFLNTIKIPSKIKSLEYSCFNGCINLEFIKIPSTLENIENTEDRCFGCFGNIDHMEQINVVIYENSEDESSAERVKNLIMRAGFDKKAIAVKKRKRNILNKQMRYNYKKKNIFGDVYENISSAYNQKTRNIEKGEIENSDGFYFCLKNMLNQYFSYAPSEINLFLYFKKCENFKQSLDYIHNIIKIYYGSDLAIAFKDFQSDKNSESPLTLIVDIVISSSKNKTLAILKSNDEWILSTKILKNDEDKIEFIEKNGDKITLENFSKTCGKLKAFICFESHIYRNLSNELLFYNFNPIFHCKNSQNFDIPVFKEDHLTPVSSIPSSAFYDIFSCEQKKDGDIVNYLSPLKDLYVSSKHCFPLDVCKNKISFYITTFKTDLFMSTHDGSYTKLVSKLSSKHCDKISVKGYDKNKYITDIKHNFITFANEEEVFRISDILNLLNGGIFSPFKFKILNTEKVFEKAISIYSVENEETPVLKISSNNVVNIFNKQGSKFFVTRDKKYFVDVDKKSMDQEV